MKKVTSYAHACKILKRKSTLIDTSMLPAKERKAFRSLYKITVIIAAQNVLDNFTPNYKDPSQVKYNPWMYFEENKKKKSGLGLSCNGYEHSRSGSYVGSRLVVGSIDSCRYLAEKFIDLYEDWFIQ